MMIRGKFVLYLKVQGTEMFFFVDIKERVLIYKNIPTYHIL